MKIRRETENYLNNSILNYFNFQMESQPHESHGPKPKIAKKLPQIFRMPATSSKRASEAIPQEPRFGPIQPKVEIKEKKEVIKKEKKNKNPITNIKALSQLMNKLSMEMKEANKDLDKLGRFSPNQKQNMKRKIQYKYENCLTLSIVRKNQSGCLKKVLHVPTLTVHYLKQSLISSHIDKNQLTEWIQAVNQDGEECMGVLELFWNMPQDYFSLLYEYNQGLLLDSLNESLHTLPIALLKDIASLHLSGNLGIFNSHFILHQEGQKQVIRYLPLIEQSQFSISQMSQLRQIMQVELGEKNEVDGRKLCWRLGLLLLNGYLGRQILSQDIMKVQLPIKKCCLFHEILQNPQSISGLYLQSGGAPDEQFANFLCHCLRSKKNAKENIELKDLSKHIWLSKKYKQVISLGELIEVVDPAFSKHSKFQLNKMSRIVDSVGLILQNVSGVDLTINAENKGVRHLAQQLGMLDEIDQVVGDLKRVYRAQLS